MDIVARECRYVTGRTTLNGGSGDSSILTAVGVFQGMRAAAEHLWGDASLEGRLVGVEGVGKVVHRLVEHLLDAGARVAICDVNAETAARVLGQHPEIAVAESRQALLALPLDVLAPCAMGGTLDDDTVATLSARIVCGGANNQLAHPGIEKMLADRGILYAPDYVVNAGGVVQVADELAGFNFQRAQARASEILTTTRKIFALADKEGVPPAVAADRLAELRMAEVGRLRGIWLGRWPPATAAPTACGSAADRPRPGSIIACEIPRGAPTAPGEALAAQSRYGYRRTQAGMHVVPHAMAATAAYYAVQEARGYPVQGAGA